MMIATIQKWGDSLAVRLPKHLAEEAQLGEGKEVELVSTEERVVLRSRKKVRYRLADLIAGITPQNTHSETEWGAEVGRDERRRGGRGAPCRLGWQ